MKLLVLSVGTRVKLLQYMKENKRDDNKVFAADASKNAPALYFADDYFIVPRIDSKEYIPSILELCSSQGITHIMSLIDPEIMKLSEHREIFEEKGISVVCSEHKTIMKCTDKYLFFQELENTNIPTVKTYKSIKKLKKDLNNKIISLPVFYKPQDGSASNNIGLINNLEELKRFEGVSGFIFQEFMEGPEIGVDLYVDMHTGKLCSLYGKNKIRMRAGETDKSIAYYSKELVDIIENLVAHFNFTGPIDVDLFKTSDGYKISEVNPRFGGGYLHAHETGFNHVQLLFDNLNGDNVMGFRVNDNDQSICLKYSETYVIKER